MYCSNKTSKTNVLLRYPQCRIYSSQSEDLKKKVTCMINASTATKSFIGDFMSDKMENKIASPSLSSANSPLFYKSSSSENEKMYQTSFPEPIQINLTPTSSTETQTTYDWTSSSSNIRNIPIMHTRSPKKPFPVLSNTTTSETFGFIFALENSQIPKISSQDFETTETAQINHIRKYSSRQYSNELLSIKDKPLRKANFEFQKPKFDDPMNVNVKEDLRKHVTNRKIVSVIYPQVLPVIYHPSGYDLLNLELMKNISVESNNNVNKTFNLDYETELPLNAEGDTYDNYSDMLKIYPNVDEIPSHYELPKASLPTTTSMASGLHNIGYNVQAEMLKPEKIFTQLHHNLNEVKRISTKNYRKMKNHSMETMKFFHRSLVMGEC